jgi:iron-regulated transporter 1
MIQDLSTIGNKLSLELDWVPLLVGPVVSQTKYSLTQINAVMRRIDMICKLVAPSLLPLVVSNMASHKAWIMLLAGVTILFWGLEVWCARVIVRENPILSQPKEHSKPDNLDPHERQTKKSTLSVSRKVYDSLFRDPFDRFTHYFSMSIWPASMALAMLQMTVLAYSATLITYLLEVGFSLTSITIARASGSIMALASTFITPLAVQYLMRWESQIEVDDQQAEDGHGKVVRKVGLWGIISQFMCTVVTPFFIQSLIADIAQLPVIVILWTLSRQLSTESPEMQPPTSSSPHLVSSLILFAFLSLSRVGHWMFDLMVQELEQVEVPETQRSTFAGIEQSFHSFFKLSHWGATIVWSRPQGIQWLALGSWAVLGVAATMFGVWSYSAHSKKVLDEVGYEGVPMVDIEREES